ncbi:hypothetical protein B6D52_03080 [Candidatus Parcubacteria bacterium 4484_255]|nr:MAG: hypothetical protein B6D52_03080 [Candidatus Parcubacteria bacterium 4484_255]
MHITWYGQSCFKLQNNKQIVLINPSEPRKAGLRGPNFKANIFILTDIKESIDEKILKKNNSFLISGPGEYEVNKIFIYGIPIKKDGRIKSIIYQVNMDEVRCGVLGQLDSSPSGEELDKLDGVDVLFVPIGGKDDFSVGNAIELINSLEPKIIIPCCYNNNPGVEITSLPLLKRFLKEAGIKDSKSLPKLSIKNKDLLSQGESKIIILENV